jgi:hypothetical protein
MLRLSSLTSFAAALSALVVASSFDAVETLLFLGAIVISCSACVRVWRGRSLSSRSLVLVKVVLHYRH